MTDEEIKDIRGKLVAAGWEFRPDMGTWERPKKSMYETAMAIQSDDLDGSIQRQWAAHIQFLEKENAELRRQNAAFLSKISHPGNFLFTSHGLCDVPGERLSSSWEDWPCVTTGATLPKQAENPLFRAIRQSTR
jgi:hypothetical protein